MGKKYSINSAGRIVAERDIYSLGGFIPKGRAGGKIASEEQLSQDGECWIAGGDISIRPDVRIRDNAYIGDFFTNESPVHTDGVMEFSGNTKIPGNITFRCSVADIKNDVIVKDTFIGISMDCVCGPATNTKAFPFEQGRYNQDAPKGTLFTSGTMKLDAENFVRNTATLRIGNDTYIFVPQGFNARIYWAYFDTSSQLAYAGESETATSALYKLSHPIYNLCMVAYAKNPTLTPAELETSGARVIGHISGSLLMDLRPESASGVYVMDGSNFIMPTDNFALATTQLRFLAGELINTTMYTKTDRQDYKPYGTFRNVKRLEYIQYLSDAHRGNANRDHYIVASDSPLVRISEGFVSGPLVNAGGVTLRRCIVPKASFSRNKVLGNTYEDIDFSYAQEHIGKTVAGRTLYSSHMQGHYDMFSSEGELTGVISRPENVEGTTRLTEAHVSIPLDGDLIEQGTYEFLPGQSFEDCKIGAGDRVRMRTPILTRGVVIPSMPSGYKVRYAFYLDEHLIMSDSEEEPTSLRGDNPYVLLAFRKEESAALLPVSEFVSKNISVQTSDYLKYPIVSGSGYVGANVTVRGDVQVIGQPYLDRTLDRNLFEIGGTLSSAMENGWGAAKTDQTLYTGTTRTRLKETYPVEPGDKLSCADGYFFICYYFREDGSYLSGSAWGTSFTVPDGAASVGILTSKGATQAENAYITLDDMGPMHVRLLRPFKTARYITNEIDRKDPRDIFLSQDAWQVSAISTGSAYVGRKYDSLKQASNKWCVLKRPINAGKSWTITLGDAVTYTQTNSSWDGETILLGLGVKDNAMLAGLELKKVSNEIITLLDVPAARFVVEYVPTPRIAMPYGSTAMLIRDVKVRLYDNAVINKSFEGGKEVILTGNAVFGRASGFIACVCANGHDDAIIKLP